jgi:hypothetical protein
MRALASLQLNPHGDVGTWYLPLPIPSCFPMDRPFPLSTPKSGHLLRKIAGDCQNLTSRGQSPKSQGIKVPPFPALASVFGRAFWTVSGFTGMRRSLKGRASGYGIRNVPQKVFTHFSDWIGENHERPIDVLGRDMAELVCKSKLR